MKARSEYAISRVVCEDLMLVGSGEEGRILYDPKKPMPARDYWAPDEKRNKHAVNGIDR